MKTIINQYETDWLASRPVFYNTKTAKAGYNINDVIDFSNIEIHSEGFNNYLDFGYSVFEQTPVENVKMLRHSSILRIYDDNSFEVEYLPDPIEAWFGKTTNEENVLELLQASITKWENSTTGDIVLPLSGGFDSRLLASMISDKSRLRCFTYGISPNQAESYEVVNAKKIAELLHLQWNQIELGDFHKYFDNWDNLFGISVNSGGIYHIEFYKKLLNNYSGSMNFLSGIIGDAWAGNIGKSEIQKWEDIYKLGYTHGISASSKYSLLPSNNTMIQSFYNENKDKLQFDFYQIITTIRLKIILLSYLVSVPESFGFSVFAPYLDINIALSMLCLSIERRRNRQWQRDYFQKKGIYIENLNLVSSSQNTLDFDAANRIRVLPLQYKIYKSYINKKYIDDINKINRYNLTDDLEIFMEKCIAFTSKYILYKRLHVPGIFNRFLILIRKIRGGKYLDFFLKRYNAYLTLKPFEYLFRSQK